MIASARSLLFVPGDRPERFAKAAASGADAVVLDLEDAVAADAKDDALGHVVAWLAAGHPTVVRVTSVGSSDHDAQVEALVGTGAVVMLAKTESADQVAAVRTRSGGAEVLALVETPVGVRDIDAITAAGVVRIALGTIDLAAEMGVDPSSHDAFTYTRSRLVLSSAAAGLPGPVDGVTTRLDDRAALDADLAVSRTLGFTGKLCVHPRQVRVVNDALSPSSDELAWAERVLDAVAGAGGVAVVDGAMVDAPVVTRAQRLVSRGRPRP